ncbi:FHA domain-containing protein [Nocardia camponoti]|uniref:FHA domain-containing protein n=1 Tax=Nocardia camponoti TaxID=1616106 RepID=A0A917QRS4_9NOCA|nr:FHA domain-containing protein [Nocardia camponoti]GGK64034.1 hypothetical protein GCM10011591_40420 [Nocardia camponoti]
MHQSTVAIVPGTGIVARFGDVIVYLAGETPSTDRLLGAIETAAASVESAPGAALAQRLAPVVFGGAASPPPFGVLAPTADGTLLLLRGAVLAEISGAEGNRRVAGDRAFTWVDEIIREPVRRIAIAAEASDPTGANPRTDLRAGIVNGNGFVLTLGRRTRAPRRVSGIEEPPVTQASGFAVLRPPTRPEPVVPAPAGTQAPSPAQAHAAPVEGETVSTGPRHTPDTAPPLAWSQALDLSQQVVDKFAAVKAAYAEQPHRPHGALVTTDGLSYPLDRPYVLGRNPSGDESVRASAATALLIERDRQVSRVHAFIAPEAGKVFVREAPATSGTFLAAPDSDRWSRVGTIPIELQPGWRLRINDFLLTYCV